MNEPLSVDGLFETHLTVRDLGRSVAFYRDVVGLTLALELPDRDAAFFWIARPGRALLGLWSLGTAPIGVSLHVAFGTSVAAIAEACDRLWSLGVTPLSFFDTETDEPSVIGWMPAAAVYFRDPDGHLLEYLAMLEGPSSRPRDRDVVRVGPPGFEPEPRRPMSTRAARIDPAARKRFADAIHDLSDGPTAPDVARYLRASYELDRAPSKPRPISSNRPRGETVGRTAA